MAIVARRLGLMALLVSTGGAPVRPEGMAALTQVPPGAPVFAAPGAQAIATLQVLIDRRRDDGSTVRVWRYAIHYGECAGDDQLGDPDDPTCPADGLLVSVWRDEERHSTFDLWRGPQRRRWTLAPSPPTEIIALEACEAVGGGLRRRVGYTLLIGEDLKPELSRSPKSGSAPTC